MSIMNLIKVLLWPFRVGFNSLLKGPYELLLNHRQFAESGQKWAKNYLVWPVVVFTLMLFTVFAGDKLPNFLFEKSGMMYGQAALLSWCIGLVLQVPTIKRFVDGRMSNGTNDILTGQLAVFMLILSFWGMAALLALSVVISVATYSKASRLPELQPA